MKLAVVCIAIIISGCASSMRYSPALNLPAVPLPAKTAQIAGGVSLVAETRPFAAEQKTSFSMEGIARYGIDNDVSLQVRGWVGGGVSFSGECILTRNEAEKSSFSIIPTFAIIRSYGYGDYTDGYGAAIYGATRFGAIGNFYPYVAVAPVFGWTGNLFEDTDNSYGYGLITNLGTTYMLSRKFSLNLELAVTASYNKYDDIAYIIPTPSLMIMWTF